MQDAQIAQLIDEIRELDAQAAGKRMELALLHGIDQMLAKAGVETVEEFVEQIMALPVRERDFMADQLDAFEYIGCLGGPRQSA